MSTIETHTPFMGAVRTLVALAIVAIGANGALANDKTVAPTTLPEASAPVSAAPILVPKGNVTSKYFYQNYVNSTCGSDICGLTLDVVKRNQRIEIEQYSCIITLDSNGKILYVSVINQHRSGIDTWDFVTPIATAGSPGTYFIAQSQIPIVATAKDTLSFFVATDGSNITNLICKAAGELVQLQ